MDADRGIEVTLKDGIARVAIRGDVDWRLGMEAVARALGAAGSAGTRMVLFDIRAAVHKDFHSDVLRHASRASEVGLSRMRIAVLGRHDDKMLPFIKDVATNRSMEVGVFAEESGAIAWLLERPT